MKILLTSVLLGVSTSLDIEGTNRTARQFWQHLVVPTIPLQATWPLQVRVQPNAIAPLMEHHGRLESTPSKPSLLVKPLGAQATALQFPSELRTGSPYSGWPKTFSRDPPFEFNDCLYNFYHCSDSATPGWPSNRDQCASDLTACQEYLSVNRKPTQCAPTVCNCPASDGDSTSTSDSDTESGSTVAKSCEDLNNAGERRSGVYKINIDNRDVEVFCTEQDGGGWTVLQRRGGFGADAEFFNKNWEEYKRGFGNVTQDVWMGLDVWHKMTASEPQQMLVKMVSEEGDIVSIVIDDLYIDNEENKYTINFSTARTREQDFDMIESLLNHRQATFKTPDSENDTFDCAKGFKAGWWFIECYTVCLTLPPGGRYGGVGGMHWAGRPYTGPTDWKRSEMKIRPMSRPFIIE